MARLISHFLYDQKKLINKEPFKRFISIGMVKGESFRTNSGKYIEPSLAVQKGKLNFSLKKKFNRIIFDKLGNKYFHKDTNEELIKNVEKMSKR